MSEVPTYDELFARNLGVFTPEQQARIAKLRIAIAGAGGVGAPVAYALARLGVAEIRIADPEEFEPSNVNRQFGAYVDTIGMNKAEAVASELRRINPHLKTVVYPSGINEENVSEFLTGADALMDAVEFFDFPISALLHGVARSEGIWVFTAQAAAEVHTQYAVSPEGLGVAEWTVDDSGVSALARIIDANFPVLPKAATPEAIQAILDGDELHIASSAPLPSIGGGLVAQDMVFVLVRGDKAIAVFPDVFVLNTDTMKTQVIRRS